MAHVVNLNAPGTDNKKAGIREQVLTALCSQVDPMDLDTLCEKVGAKRRTAVTRAMTRLITAKSVKRIEKGVYQATPKGRDRIKAGWRKSGPLGPLTGNRASKTNSFRQRLWKVLRATRKGTTDDLVILASRGAEKAAMSSARTYLNALASAGYVHKRKGGEQTTWWLMEDTGPTAPVHNPRTKKLRDPNNGKTIDLRGGDDE